MLSLKLFFFKIKVLTPIIQDQAQQTAGLILNSKNTKKLCIFGLNMDIFLYSTYKLFHYQKLISLQAFGLFVLRSALCVDCFKTIDLNTFNWQLQGEIVEIIIPQKPPYNPHSVNSSYPGVTFDQGTLDLTMYDPRRNFSLCFSPKICNFPNLLSHFSE